MEGCDSFEKWWTTSLADGSLIIVEERETEHSFVKAIAHAAYTAGQRAQRERYFEAAHLLQDYLLHEQGSYRIEVVNAMAIRRAAIVQDYVEQKATLRQQEAE